MRLLIEGTSFALALLAGVAAGISPNPDEAQRVLPWPSWTWQRFSLLATIPMAVLVALIFVPAEIWPGVGLALLWTALACYSGVATRWLRSTRQAPLAARVAGGACVAMSWALLLLALIAAIFYVVVMALLTVASYFIARETVREWLRKVK